MRKILGEVVEKAVNEWQEKTDREEKTLKELDRIEMSKTRENMVRKRKRSGGTMSGYRTKYRLVEKQKTKPEVSEKIKKVTETEKVKKGGKILRLENPHRNIAKPTKNSDKEIENTEILRNRK